MYFGPIPIADAAGCLLAHSLSGAAGRVRKGTSLDTAALASLAAAGHTSLVVARLDADDEHEDTAARRIAVAFAGDGVRLGAAGTGRVNLFSTVDGIVDPSRDALREANRVSDAITIATLAENSRVSAGRLVATVKIIPFAVPTADVDRAVEQLAGRRLRVAAIAPRTAGLIHTTLPALKDSVIAKTSRVTHDRVAARGAMLIDERRCAHDTVALAAELVAMSGGVSAEVPDAVQSDVPGNFSADTGGVDGSAASSGVAGSAGAAAASGGHAPLDWLLVVGASAVADRQDVVPAAIEAAGGRVRRVGLPMDPGNLLVLGDIGDTVVIGLPGCARSPRDNGLDRVLDRLACGLPMTDAWLESLAIGGLLDEIVERPSPRVSALTREHVATIVLAAGSSRRTGDTNKLLHPVAGEPMLRRVVRQALEADVGPVIVITGHERERTEAALDGLAVTLRHNAAHALGIASSIVCGISTVIDGGLGDSGGPGGPGGSGVASMAGVDGVIVRLGDMPDISTATVGALVQAFRAKSAPALFVPVTGDGRRGNPVLVSRTLFDTLLGLEGDTGARGIIRDNPSLVCEVVVDDAGILVDYDTPADLERLR